MVSLFFRRLSAILILVILFLGCTTNKTISENENIGLKAENTTEGIVLMFDNIPSNTTRLFIHINEISEDMNPIPVFTDIRGHYWIRLKKKGKFYVHL